MNIDKIRKTHHDCRSFSKRKTWLFMANKNTWFSRGGFDSLSKMSNGYSPTSIWYPACQGLAVKGVEFEIPSDGPQNSASETLSPSRTKICNYGTLASGLMGSGLKHLKTILHFLKLAFPLIGWNASTNWMFWSPQTAFLKCSSHRLHRSRDAPANVGGSRCVRARSPKRDQAVAKFQVMQFWGFATKKTLWRIEFLGRIVI